MPGPQTLCYAGRWRSTRAFWNAPTTTSRPGVPTALQRLRCADDTLVFYIIDDSSASAEARSTAPTAEMLNFNGLADIETPRFMTISSDRSAGRVLQPLFGRLGACDGYLW